MTDDQFEEEYRPIEGGPDEYYVRFDSFDAARLAATGDNHVWMFRAREDAPSEAVEDQYEYAPATADGDHWVAIYFVVTELPWAHTGLRVHLR